MTRNLHSETTHGWFLETVRLSSDISCNRLLKTTIVLTEGAVALLCERLSTPLQFEKYLTLAFEEGFRIAQKPIDADTIESVLAVDLDALETRLMRNGYDAKILSEILNAKPGEIRAFLRGQLPPGRTQELHQELLAAGVPL